MPIVVSRSQRWRVLAAHAFLIAFLIFTLFPLVMVVSISLRAGNFATSSIIPEQLSLEHWKLALGIPVVEPDGTVVPPPFPVMRWLWNSIKVAMVAATLIVALSTT